MMSIALSLSGCTFAMHGVSVDDGGSDAAAPEPDALELFDASRLFDALDGQVPQPDAFNPDDASRLDGAAPLDIGAPDQSVICGRVGESCCSQAPLCADPLACNNGKCVQIPAIDGNASSNDYSSGISVTLTTSKPSDLLYIAAVLSTDQTASLPTSNPSLDWTLRKRLTYGSKQQLVAYSATWPASGQIQITIGLDGKTHWAASAFAVSDAYMNSPFDGIPPTATGNSNNPGVQVTTSNPVDLIVGIVGMGSTPTVTPGGGFSLVVQSAYSTSREVAVESAAVSSTQNNLPVGYTLSSVADWGMLVEAIRAP